MDKYFNLGNFFNFYQANPTFFYCVMLPSYLLTVMVLTLYANLWGSGLASGALSFMYTDSPFINVGILFTLALTTCVPLAVFGCVLTECMRLNRECGVEMAIGSSFAKIGCSLGVRPNDWGSLKCHGNVVIKRPEKLEDPSSDSDIEANLSEEESDTDEPSPQGPSS